MLCAYSTLAHAVIHILCGICLRGKLASPPPLPGGWRNAIEATTLSTRRVPGSLTEPYACLFYFLTWVTSWKTACEMVLDNLNSRKSFWWHRVPGPGKER